MKTLRHEKQTHCSCVRSLGLCRMSFYIHLWRPFHANSKFTTRGPLQPHISHILWCLFFFLQWILHGHASTSCLPLWIWLIGWPLRFQVKPLHVVGGKSEAHRVISPKCSEMYRICFCLFKCHLLLFFSLPLSLQSSLTKFAESLQEMINYHTVRPQRQSGWQQSAGRLIWACSLTVGGFYSLLGRTTADCWRGMMFSFMGRTAIGWKRGSKKNQKQH